MSALLGMKIDFARCPVEVIVREERVEKTAPQRALFHAACSDLAPLLGLTPGQTKLRVKAAFYGVDVKTENGVYVALVPSSESSDREEYSRLIDHVYQFAAEGGFELPDRRAK